MVFSNISEHKENAIKAFSRLDEIARAEGYETILAGLRESSVRGQKTFVPFVLANELEQKRRSGYPTLRKYEGTDISKVGLFSPHIADYSGPVYDSSFVLLEVDGLTKIYAEDHKGSGSFEGNQETFFEGDEYRAPIVEDIILAKI